jgi:hypothetical protein
MHIVKRCFHQSASIFRDLQSKNAFKQGPLDGIRVLDLTRVLGKRKYDHLLCGIKRIFTSIYH